MNIQVISMYKQGDIWYFSDDGMGILHEPFVCGMSEMIDDMLGSLSLRTARASFCSQPRILPSFVLLKLWEREGGCWYAGQGMKGWFCPVLYRYFRKAPERLYVSFTVPSKG